MKKVKVIYQVICRRGDNAIGTETVILAMDENIKTSKGHKKIMINS